MKRHGMLRSAAGPRTSESPGLAARALQLPEPAATLHAALTNHCPEHVGQTKMAVVAILLAIATAGPPEPCARAATAHGMER